MFTCPRNLMRYLFNTKTALPYEKETNKAIIILLFVCAVSASGHELFMQNTKIKKKNYYWIRLAVVNHINT